MHHRSQLPQGAFCIIGVMLPILLAIAAVPAVNPAFGSIIIQQQCDSINGCQLDVSAMVYGHVLASSQVYSKVDLAASHCHNIPEFIITKYNIPHACKLWPR